MPRQTTPSPAQTSAGTPPVLEVALMMLTLVPREMGGSETYAHELTRELTRLPGLGVRSYVSGVGAGFSAGVPEHVLSEITGGASAPARLRTLARASAPGFLARRGLTGADVVHYPFTVPVPRAGRRQARVVSLLDTQHHDMPALFSRAEHLYRRWFYDRAAQRADAVVTISEFAKRRIRDTLGVSEEQIFVAHLGVDQDEFVPHLGVREHFLLYPARGWPHKNHARLFEAFELLRRDDPDLRLVLTGGGLGNVRDMPSGVEVRGHVTRAELLELYRSAAALVFPSLYEGFGLPPLEAMASGCPVAASDAGALPEVCGDAAVLFDGTDPAAIAAGVRAALAAGPALQGRGLDQVRRFTWAACAQTHESAYRFAAASRAATHQRPTARA